MPSKPKKKPETKVQLKERISNLKAQLIRATAYGKEMAEQVHDEREINNGLRERIQELEGYRRAWDAISGGDRNV